MERGKLKVEVSNLKEIQQYYLENIKNLPNTFKIIDKEIDYRVEISEELRKLTKMLQNKK